MGVISGGRIIGYEGQTVVHTPVMRTTATTPVDGAAGTYAGFAEIGSHLMALDTSVVYVNTGTVAEPVWTLLGEQGA